jgi:hypothetical protein
MKAGWAVLALTLGLAAPAAAEAVTATAAAMPTAVTTAVTTAASTAVPTAAPTTVPMLAPTAVAETPAGSPLSLSPAAWSDHGFEYGFSLSALSLSNASPLAYSPIQVGWRFANGVRARTGLDLFYYEATESDPAQGNAPSLFSYSMQDWRSTLAYEVALPFAIRPVVGLCFDFIWGGKQLADPLPNTVNNAGGAWGGLGAGGLLGLEWRTSEHWSLAVAARYTLIAAPGPLAAVDLGFHYLF